MARLSKPLVRAVRFARSLPLKVSRTRESDSGELRGSFQSLEEWLSFRGAHEQIRDPAYIEAIVAEARAKGAVSAFFGHIPARDIVITGSNYREGLFAAGLNPRQRAVMDLFAEDPRSRDFADLRIYAHEATTPLALAFRGRYPRFFGSEYAPDAAGRDRLFPIPVIDITASGFPDAAFDVVLSVDVLEHVPDLDAALADTARILRPGGRFLATFPFLDGTNTTQVKAVLEHGRVRHLATPEYHGNPVDPAGSLVFQLPGWDIVQRARAAGFREASMVFWSSRRSAFTGAEIAGVFVFDARR